MRATMMDVPLTIERILDRAAGFGDVEIVSRRPDKSLERTTYADVVARARRLAHVLVAAGIQPGDRVATLMWNHAEHLEAYLGVPLSGGITRSSVKGTGPNGTLDDATFGQLQDVPIWAINGQGDDWSSDPASSGDSMARPMWRKIA